MVDILKITSPIAIKSKVQNIPKQLPTDAVFDIVGAKPTVTEQTQKIKTPEEDTSGKQSLMKYLNKEILEPLMTSTKAQADSIRKLVLMAKLFESPAGVLPESFLEKIFIKPEEMMGELLNREKGETIFKGEFFDSLRILAKLEGQPKLKEAIVAILKNFDGYVHQENTVNTIVQQTKNLLPKLPKAEAQVLQQQIETLDTLFKLDKTNQTEIKTYLKNELIPNLGKIVKHHQGSNKIHSQVMAIVHNIVRYDKAEPRRLEEAIFQLGDELKPLTNLTDEDVVEMKKLIFEHAKDERQLIETSNNIDKKTMEKLGMENEGVDMATLLTKALDKEGPTKINSVAQNLLAYMVQSESPMLPMMHFMIPFRYLDENTYGEFFVDKDCKDRKGGAKEAKNIFFTIQSDKYGNFEVDLLAKDKAIELDIRCPDILLDSVKATRQRLREIVEEQGYRLSGYNVGIYKESQTILQRFPKLALRKAGVDVKI